MSKRAKKSQYRRRKAKIQPERPVSDDPLYGRIVAFVEQSDSLALDDSHDRQTLAERMYDFVLEEKHLTRSDLLEEMSDHDPM
jgi:hypothetical protein